jgi:hypothetical protein
VILLVIGMAITFPDGYKHSLINPNRPRKDNEVVLPRAEIEKSAAIETAVYVVKEKVTVPD